MTDAGEEWKRDMWVAFKYGDDDLERIAGPFKSTSEARDYAVRNEFDGIMMLVDPAEGRDDDK